MLTANDEACAEDGAGWAKLLVRKLNVPALSAYGIGSPPVEDIAAKAARASSMKANPVELTASELRWILEKAI